MIPIPGKAWLGVGVAVVVAALGIALKVQTSRLDSVKAEFNQFKGGVAALAEKAKAESALRELHDLRNKERADEEYDRRVRAVRATIAQLRHQRDSARSAFLSTPPSGTRCPDGVVCFDRPEYLRAYGELTGGLRALADQCTEMSVVLDTAAPWARGLRGD